MPSSAIPTGFNCTQNTEVKCALIRCRATAQHRNEKEWTSLLCHACNRLQHNVVADSQNITLLLQLVGKGLQIGYITTLHCNKAVAGLNIGAGCNSCILLDKAHKGLVCSQHIGTFNAHKRFNHHGCSTLLSNAVLSSHLPWTL